MNIPTETLFSDWMNNLTITLMDTLLPMDTLTDMISQRTPFFDIYPFLMEILTEIPIETFFLVDYGYLKDTLFYGNPDGKHLLDSFCQDILPKIGML